MEKTSPSALAQDSQNIAPSKEYLKTNQNLLKKRADFYLKNSKGEIKSRKKGGLKLTVTDMVYFEDEVYLVLALENRTEITFEPDFLNVYLSRGNRKRNASYQRLLQEPRFTLNFPKNIYPHQEKQFVLVFSKFTVGENEKIELEVREKNGSRYLRWNLKI